MVLHMKTKVYFLYLAQFFLEWKMFHTKATKKFKTHILCSKNFFQKSWHLWDKVEKFCRAGLATDYNMGLAHCIQDNYGYKHNLCLHNTYCFYPATMVAQMHLNSIPYIHCLSCYSQILVTDSLFSSPKVFLFPL